MLLAQAGRDVSYLVNDGHLVTVQDKTTGLCIPIATGTLPAPTIFSRVALADWWRDPMRIVGKLTSAEHSVTVIDVVTAAEYIVAFPCEEKLATVKQRFETAYLASRRCKWRVAATGCEIDDALSAMSNGIIGSCVHELETLGFAADIPNLPVIMFDEVLPPLSGCPTGIGTPR